MERYAVCYQQYRKGAYHAEICPCFVPETIQVFAAQIFEYPLIGQVTSEVHLEKINKVACLYLSMQTNDVRISLAVGNHT